MTATEHNGEVIEGTAVEVYHPEPPAALFGTTDPVEVVAKAAAIADALKAVIDAKRLYTNVQGKQHINVEGWQLLGSMLGVTAVCVATEPVDGGFKATVEARSADGRVVGRADALCTKHEKRGPWKGADDYARLSMAQTRATSKALKGPLGFVVSLAGYATTPAEEMTFAEGEQAPAQAPPRRRSQPQAEPVQQTERLASAKQRGLLNGKADEAALSSQDYANALLRAAGQPEREFETEDQANQFVNRQLDRLSARVVDKVLEEITGVVA